MSVAQNCFIANFDSVVPYGAPASVFGCFPEIPDTTPADASQSYMKPRPANTIQDATLRQMDALVGVDGVTLCVKNALIASLESYSATNMAPPNTSPICQISFHAGSIRLSALVGIEEVLASTIDISKISEGEDSKEKHLATIARRIKRILANFQETQRLMEERRLP